VKPAPTKISEPAFVSVNDAAKYGGYSTWSVFNDIRHGRLKAKKLGRKTLVEFASLKARFQGKRCSQAAAFSTCVGR
jgi:hypothetical protein